LCWVKYMGMMAPSQWKPLPKKFSLLISLMSDIAAGKYMYLPAPSHFLGEEVVWMFSHLTCMD
jgi:hypothetical protein